ncbi:MAG: HAD family phosphatase [Calditrichaceae bacterium]|nr:HAD family phosphatase [Calditrichaceae bacterium]MBN2708249.1 HAD family phosphatase [Calditrichaceae bacterium]RQV92271.1 MAG: HAD family phosphatase [Calditrichota bacterium]
MVISDLDGTLLNNNNEISPTDIDTLKKLGTKQITRVIATGRNLYSALKALTPETPIDFLVFSSGAGILNWKTKELIFCAYISAPSVNELKLFFINEFFDFMIHDPVPDNHFFYYWSSGKQNKDFLRRLSVYKPYARQLMSKDFILGKASQFIIIVPEYHDLQSELKMKLPNLNIIRTTSPLDGKTTWIEIFPYTISKAHASQWLINQFNLNPHITLAIGNDYNDSDLLKWAGHSYVVENGVIELKDKHQLTTSNAENGFTNAVKKVYDL